MKQLTDEQAQQMIGNSGFRPRSENHPVPPFEAKVLTEEQKAQLRQNALAYVEAKAYEAWLNCLLEPSDVVRRAGYDQLLAQRDTLLSA
jgi:hypothetical protein